MSGISTWRGRSFEVILLAAGALGVAAGCQANTDIEPHRGTVTEVLPADADARAAAVSADPVAYLNRVTSKCATLEQYTLTFTRYERRGLLQVLYGPEHIKCWFRREPFSVRMKWLDENLKYDESTYVAGEEKDQVRFVTRWWSPPLLPPPSVNKVDLKTPVLFGEAQRPMTDFGLEQMMERTLESLERAGEDVVITYEGLLQLPENGPTAHFIHLEYPENQHRAPIQEMYIDVRTDLPAGTIIKYPNGRIDAAYYYTDIATDVSLTDEDFLLEAERKQHSDAGNDEQVHGG